MNGSQLTLTAVAFVALFSTGFIFADLALTGSEPFTFLAYRMLFAAALLAGLAVLLKSKWPQSWAQIAHIAFAGLLLQAIYLGGVFWAISQGVPPGISGIIAGLQPIIALFFYVMLTGRWLSVWDGLGACLGFLGVLLIVWQKLSADIDLSWAIAVNFLGAVAYALGAVYTSKYVRSRGKVPEMAVQFAAAGVGCLLMALLFEDMRFALTPQVMGAFLWSVVMLSIIGIFLMLFLIDRGGAKYFSFWNFLMPAFSAAYAWAFRDEAFGPTTLIGILLVVVGLFVVNAQGLFGKQGLFATKDKNAA